MRRALLVLAASGLAATWMGCQESTVSTPQVSQGTVDASSGAADSASSSEFTLVTLSVPNMT